MVAWLVTGLVLIVIFLIAIKLSGKTAEELGRSDEKRKSLEKEVQSIDIFMEKLSSPPPDSASLATRWLRRIKRSEHKVDTSLSDTDNGSID
jgi:hypothetical protein